MAAPIAAPSGPEGDGVVSPHPWVLPWWRMGRFWGWRASAPGGEKPAKLGKTEDVWCIWEQRFSIWKVCYSKNAELALILAFLGFCIFCGFCRFQSRKWELEQVFIDLSILLEQIKVLKFMLRSCLGRFWGQSAGNKEEFGVGSYFLWNSYNLNQVPKSSTKSSKKRSESLYWQLYFPTFGFRIC